MTLLLDSFWRAAAYCLHPRVIALSLLPLLLMSALAFGAGWFFWEPALDAVQDRIGSWALLGSLVAALEGAGLTGLRAALAPLVVVLLATPVIVVCSLLAVAMLMTPAMVSLVAARRFPQLERRRGGSLLGALFGGAWATLAALLALLLSLPLWFVPPLVLVLPPLIWGWLTYRLMGYDVLAEHADAVERRALLREHGTTLLAMGVLCGYLGAAPSVVWASGVLFVAMAPLLVPVAVWIYTLVFAFSGLWFAHYALAALEARRRAAPAAPPSAAAASGPVLPLPRAAEPAPLALPPPPAAAAPPPAALPPGADAPPPAGASPWPGR
ncbi:EI24 domain-containing protein [Piscinibacter sakaiensis]|uniref:Putative transmembrane protein n=1 Tax=Piscinibacter sakaiensis TaxID=1547922 RepID=A0A0K8P2T2_PISS1|nr:EI24 domain-containing protein [Piscinibacter sakaiensis]GAP36987.1 putative transmembrane protein [Piscinibacter sakaiensis]